MALGITDFDQIRFISRLWGGARDWNSSMGIIKETTEVDFRRHELDVPMIKYQLIRDCLGGEVVVKNEGERYLPRPSKELSLEEDSRYYDYIKRANFLGATALTQRTIVGKLFAKEPTIELPDLLKPLIDNVDGEGLSLGQFLERCIAEVFAFGRCAVYADFRDSADQEVSIYDLETKYPTLTFCPAENIINWRIDKLNKKVTMVVIKEYYEMFDNFAVMMQPQYRVFRLDETGQVVVDVWREHTIASRQSFGVDQTSFYVFDTYEPKYANRMRWTEIPVSIIGAINNDWHVDDCPLYQIALLEMSLYRNSADLEETAFRLGQPTPWIAGIDEQSIEDLGLKNLRLGSGQVLTFTDPNTKVGMLQPSPQTLLDNLIEQKLSLLRQLGAMIHTIDSLGQNQTATGAIYQALQMHAPIVTTSNNVFNGIKKALIYAHKFISNDMLTVEDIELKPNSEIIDKPIGLVGISVVIQLVDANLITWDEARELLRVQGLTSMTNEEALAKLAEEGLGQFNRDDQQMMMTDDDQQDDQQTDDDQTEDDQQQDMREDASEDRDR